MDSPYISMVTFNDRYLGMYVLVEKITLPMMMPPVDGIVANNVLIFNYFYP